MGMPNIPDIKAEFDLDFKEILKLLMASIALEEVGLSHMINAEGEKMQKYLGLDNLSKHDLLKLNDRVNEFLSNAVNKNKILAGKLDTVKEFIEYIAQYYDCKEI